MSDVNSFDPVDVFRYSWNQAQQYPTRSERFVYITISMILWFFLIPVPLGLSGAILLFMFWWS